MTVPYTKPWLSVSGQIEKLKTYGLVVQDHQSASEFLEHLNYYRFSGYGVAFEKVRHVFLTGTTFEDIIDAYYFDRALRDLVTESLEVIELDLRAALAYDFGQHYGAFGHASQDSFFHRFKHKAWLDKLYDETKRSDEAFVKHYRNTYSEFPDLPIWVATEIMSFGALSRMYSGMIKADQKTIAARYGMQPRTLQSWMHHLVYVRNLCAHHVRLWDRIWAIRPDLPPGHNWRPPLLPTNQHLFVTLLVQAKLLGQCPAEKNFSTEWRNRIECLIEKKKPRTARADQLMGLPANWKDHPVWSAL